MKKLSILFEQEDLFNIDQRIYLKYKNLLDYSNKEFFKPFGIYEYNIISKYSWINFKKGLLIPFGLDILHNNNGIFKYMYFLNCDYNKYEEEWTKRKDFDKILKNCYWSFNSAYMDYPGSITIFNSCNFSFIKDLDFSLKNFCSYFIKYQTY